MPMNPESPSFGLPHGEEPVHRRSPLLPHGDPAARFTGAPPVPTGSAQPGSSSGHPAELPNDQRSESNHQNERQAHARAEIIELIQETAQLIRELLTAHLTELGVNEIRYPVLKIVEAAAPPGCTQAELAVRLGQAESSICTLVERMRGDGLIYRMRAKNDRRKRLLVLTERGRKLLATIDERHRHTMNHILNGLDWSHQNLLAQLLRSLKTQLAALKQNPPNVSSLPPRPHFLSELSGMPESAIGPETISEHPSH